MWGVAKILVVDDQLGVRRLLFETFREDQHEVEMAANGEEAVQLLKTFKPDLIMMDMKMPGMNGIETLKQIRALDRQVGVIMMTAYGDAQNMEQAKDLGILHYLGKPFDLFELRDRVRTILTGV
ncbi:response regulator [Desulfosporosinus youngiae]|uniref:Stage 0 sporulation protein A homolog n=1 Tax=Desulfosporosinus youngiae DSM 17734 TaxID=768710 RepID=H5Y0M9_9FIRM|nr:response regulator [Desulfosporosinus youngiae]EHQ92285.1 response regulator with CheY-like receiver, AAA-type ATPase, and DNA-binding domains [Desulfosporosinus youngiae DSM 17734]